MSESVQQRGPRTIEQLLADYGDGSKLDHYTQPTVATAAAIEASQPIEKDTKPSSDEVIDSTHEASDIPVSGTKPEKLTANESSSVDASSKLGNIIRPIVRDRRRGVAAVAGLAVTVLTGATVSTVMDRESPLDETNLSKLYDDREIGTVRVELQAPIYYSLAGNFISDNAEITGEGSTINPHDLPNWLYPANPFGQDEEPGSEDETDEETLENRVSEVQYRNDMTMHVMQMPGENGVRNDGGKAVVDRSKFWLVGVDYMEKDSNAPVEAYIGYEPPHDESLVPDELITKEMIDELRSTYDGDPETDAIEPNPTITNTILHRAREAVSDPDFGCTKDISMLADAEIRAVIQESVANQTGEELRVKDIEFEGTYGRPDTFYEENELGQTLAAPENETFIIPELGQIPQPEVNCTVNQETKSNSGRDTLASKEGEN